MITIEYTRVLLDENDYRHPIQTGLQILMNESGYSIEKALKIGDQINAKVSAPKENYFWQCPLFGDCDPTSNIKCPTKDKRQNICQIPHDIYLLINGTRVKVGITQTHRLLNRCIENSAAIFYKFLSVSDYATARRIESDIASTIKLVHSQIRKNQKSSLIAYRDRDQLIPGIEKVIKLLFKEYQVKFEKNRLIFPIYPEISSIRITELKIMDLSENQSISGEVMSLFGYNVVVQNSQGDLELYDFSKLHGGLFDGDIE